MAMIDLVVMAADERLLTAIIALDNSAATVESLNVTRDKMTTGGGLLDSRIDRSVAGRFTVIYIAGALL